MVPAAAAVGAMSPVAPSPSGRLTLRESHNRQMGRRVLITTWDGGGNTTPAHHLALHLLRRHAEVLLMGWPSMAARAERDAIPFTTYSRLPP
jgi:hypothetical protein